MSQDNAKAPSSHNPVSPPPANHEAPDNDNDDEEEVQECRPKNNQSDAPKALEYTAENVRKLKNRDAKLRAYLSVQERRENCKKAIQAQIKANN